MVYGLNLENKNKIPKSLDWTKCRLLISNGKYHTRSGIC